MDMGCCYSEFHALCDRLWLYISKHFTSGWGGGVGGHLAGYVITKV